MCQTWQEIQETYPDQWVLMKDTHFNNGELLYAEVVFVCTDPWDINRFLEENPDKRPKRGAQFYTGEAIDVNVLSDDEINISLAEAGDWL